jgi:hypothetical protein
MPVYMAVDPGPHIGVATRIDSNYVTITLRDANELWDMLREYRPSIVAVEVFFTGNRVDANMIHTIEQVGGVRAACRALGLLCYGQMPDARTSFIEDAIQLLRSQGRVLDLSKQGDDPEIQALAHLKLLEWRLKNNEARDQGKWKLGESGKNAGSHRYYPRRRG